MVAIPAPVADKLLGEVLDFLKKGGENLVKNLAAKKAIKKAIERAAERFAIEYEDHELARALATDTKFYDLASVQQAIRKLLEHPFDRAPQVIIENEFAMVLLPNQKQAANRAAQAYLELLREELIGVEKLNDKLKLIYLRRTADATERTATGVEKLVAIHEKSLIPKKPIGINKVINKEDTLSVPFSIAQEPNIGPRIRFLDALDSARFSSESGLVYSQLLRILYVKAQFFFALITGDSIVITENQLFDSLGFLEAFNEIYRAAQEVGFSKDLPVRVALRSNTDVFQIVANHIGNESFVLSLWGGVEKRQAGSRKLWADSIRSKQKPPDEITSEEEKRLLDKLWTALEYFSPERCVPAQNIPMEFTERINRVIALEDDDIEDMRIGVRNDIPQRKYFNTKSESDAAKELRDVLREIQKREGEIKTRSLIRRELEKHDNHELKAGVIELTDGIYNQTLGIATNAMLIQTSTFPVHVNKYVTAGYWLSTFVQDTSNPSNNYIHWELFSYDHFENLEGLDDSRREKKVLLMLEAARQNVPWRKIIEMQGRNVSMIRDNWTSEFSHSNGLDFL